MEKNRDELSDWMKTKIRVATLEGTSVLRVWLADGTPEEQAVIINAIWRAYLKRTEIDRQRLRERIDGDKRRIIKVRIDREENGGSINLGGLQEFEKRIQEDEEEYNSFPRLLEWAVVKRKP